MGIINQILGISLRYAYHVLYNFPGFASPLIYELYIEYPFQPFWMAKQIEYLMFHISSYTATSGIGLFYFSFVDQIFLSFIIACAWSLSF